ncbi:MAG: GNAT family N-acetyltransferase [Oligoflexales bacterium]
MIFQYSESPSEKKSLEALSQLWQQESMFWPYSELVESMKRFDISIIYDAKDQASPWEAAIILSTTFFEAEVLFVYTQPQQRGKSLGTKLVREAIEFARTRPCSKIFLEVRANNAGARHVYEKCGFRAFHSRTGYYANGDDAVMMALDLVGDGK